MNRVSIPCATRSRSDSFCFFFGIGQFLNSVPVSALTEPPTRPSSISVRVNPLVSGQAYTQPITLIEIQRAKLSASVVNLRSANLAWFLIRETHTRKSNRTKPVFRSGEECFFLSCVDSVFTLFRFAPVPDTIRLGILLASFFLIRWELKIQGFHRL